MKAFLLKSEVVILVDDERRPPTTGEISTVLAISGNAVTAISSEQLGKLDPRVPVFDLSNHNGPRCELAAQAFKEMTDPTPGHSVLDAIAAWKRGESDWPPLVSERTMKGEWFEVLTIKASSVHRVMVEGLVGVCAIVKLLRQGRFINRHETMKIEIIGLLDPKAYKHLAGYQPVMVGDWFEPIKSEGIGRVCVVSVEEPVADTISEVFGFRSSIALDSLRDPEFFRPLPGYAPDPESSQVGWRHGLPSDELLEWCLKQGGEWERFGPLSQKKPMRISMSRNKDTGEIWVEGDDGPLLVLTDAAMVKNYQNSRYRPLLGGVPLAWPGDERKAKD